MTDQYTAEQAIQYRVADWSLDRDALKSVRHQVFIEEQKVPIELEWDEHDDSAIHFIATRDGEAVACARLKNDGQIGRMAVLKAYRNQGVGQALLRLVLRTAAEKNIDDVYLHAQVSAIPFYEKQGFKAVGDIFYEADIPHREMLKKDCPINPAQAVTEELPMLYILGETDEEIHIDNVEENRNAAISLIKQARFSIDIFSQELDAELYNNKEIEQSIFNLAKRHPDTKVRILVQDSRKAVSNGHRLIKLAQNLTSSVFINTPSREFSDERCAFLVVDQLGMLYRVNGSNRAYKASINFMSPQRAGKLSEFFNEAWEHSTPDIQSRRIYV